VDPTNQPSSRNVLDAIAGRLAAIGDSWLTKVVTPRATLLLVLGLAVEAIGLAAMLPYGDFRLPGMADHFMMAAAVAVTGFALACSGLSRTKVAKLAMWGWVVAIAFRALLIPLYPGDDIWRYLWEGKIQRLGFNPYTTALDSAALVPYRDAYWPLICHASMTAIYPPLSELAFRVLATIWYHPICFKLAFTLADLGAIWFVWKLLQHRQQDDRRVWWYAWNPLVIYVFAGGGHLDSLMLVCGMASLWMLVRGREGASMVLLALAVGFKLTFALTIPLFFLALRRKAWIGLLLALLAPLLLFLRQPNPETTGIISWALSTVPWLLIGAVVLYVKFRREPVEGTHHVMLWLLLMSPLYHAWYLTWFLCLSPLVRGKAWWVVSATGFAYFWVWHRNVLTHHWEFMVSDRLVLWVPVCLVFAVELLLARRASRV
jgi:hypothetical protein